MWAQSAGEIGQIIGMARRQKGLTQVQLARAVGASQAWISEVEKGKDTAHIGKVLRVLSFLGIRLRVGEGLAERAAASAGPAGIDLGSIISAHSLRKEKRRRR